MRIAESTMQLMEIWRKAYDHVQERRVEEQEERDRVIREYVRSEYNRMTMAGSQEEIAT